MFCKNCGAKMSDGTKFCPNCGMPAKAANEESQSLNEVTDETAAPSLAAETVHEGGRKLKKKWNRSKKALVAVSVAVVVILIAVAAVVQTSWHDTGYDRLLLVEKIGIDGGLVEKIIFVDSLEGESMPEAEMVWTNSNGKSVWAWYERKGENYYVYIGADGDVELPEHFSFASLFKFDTSTISGDTLDTLTTIAFNECVDTSNVMDMSGMFSGCRSLTSLDLSSFDTSNVMDMSSMFDWCEGLTKLDLSSFDTSNVTDMSLMFEECKGLTSLDLSSFDTSNVMDMSSMFDWCEGLSVRDEMTGLDVSEHGMVNTDTDFLTSALTGQEYDTAYDGDCKGSGPACSRYG